MSFAIIETGGKQYKVSASKILEIEKLDAKVGETIKFQNVLLLNDDKTTEVGSPSIDGAMVEAKLLDNVKDRTVLIFHKRRRKHSRKKNGHRQRHSKIQITKIMSKGGKVIDEAKVTTAKKEVKKVEPQQQTSSSAPDRKALTWQKRNEWFGGSTTKDRIMTQAAMVIHKELIEEGIAPNTSSDEYYNELDMRIRDEFPEKFKNKSVKKIPTVMGGTRSTLGKNQIKLTKTEVEMANRLGVSLQEYARQKVRQTQAGG